MQIKYKEEYELMENQINLSLDLFFRGYRKAKNMEIKTKNVFIFGIGASWLAAKSFLDLFGDKLNKAIFISNSYINSITKKDLAVFISYSGKTKEVLDIHKKVKKKTKKIIFITSNRKIKERSLLIDLGLLSRSAMPFMLGCLIGLFSKHIKISEKQIELIFSLRKNLAKIKKEARFIADYIWKNYNKKLIFISDIEALALRLKNQLNENAKLTMQIASLPEAYHNEIEARHDGLIIYAKKTKKLERFIKLNKCDFIFIDSKGKNLLSFFYGLLLIDYISLYISIRNGVNPIKVSKIDEIKKIAV